jgi:putative intracellular protease/amidase
MKKYFCVFIISILFLKTVKSQNAENNVGFLLFNGVEVIDFAGPYEVLSYGDKNGKSFFKLYTVAKNNDTLVASGGMVLKPNYTFATAPRFDYLVIPGGDLRHVFNDSSTLNWIRKSYSKSKVIMSVCNGAYLLAKANILNGRTATTTAGGAYAGKLADYAKDCKVVFDRKFVRDGNVITTAGLSSGIEGALSLIQSEIGNGAAQYAALAMEYDWRPDAPFVRALLPDMTYINSVRSMVGQFGGCVILTQGDLEKWETRIEFGSQHDPKLLWTSITGFLQQKDNWVFPQARSRVDSTSEKFKAQSTFTDVRGRSCAGDLQLERSGDGRNVLTINVRLK